MLHRWNTQSYTVEGEVASKGISYSALAVSDNGTFVGTGTMSEVLISMEALYNFYVLDFLMLLCLSFYYLP